MVALRASLTAAVRMVHRIHRDTPDATALPEPSGAPRLADRNILVVEIANLADRRAAFREHHPLLARRQLEQGELALFGHQLGLGPGAARHLRSRPGFELDRMDEGADRDMLETQGVARLDIGVGAGLDLLADLEPLRREDIALVAVGIMQQGQVGRAVGIVLERRHHRRHAVAVAFEIDDPQAPLMPAAAMARGHAAEVVAAAGFLDRREQAFFGRLFGQPGKIRDLHEALARGTGIELYYRHLAFSLSLSR